MKYAQLPMSAIGQRLLALREERAGLHATTVAKAIGVTASALSQWETGATKHIRPENLLLAARFYNVSIVWLITGTGPRTIAEAETEAEASALLAFRKLSAAGQAAALAQLEWMAERDSGADTPLPNRLRHLQ